MKALLRHPAATTAAFSLLAFCALSPAVAAQTGEITGTVYDELTSATVDGITVELQDAYGGNLDSTVTDAVAGTYAFTGLAADVYLVRVSSDPARDLVGEYHQDVHEFDQDLATRLVVVAGAALTVDFQLARGGSISGNLFGLAGGEDISLQVFDAWSGRYRGGAGSNAGSFTVGSLGAASYKLFADPSGTDRAFQWYDGEIRFNLAQTIALGSDEDLFGKDLSLEAGTSISGTVSLSPDPNDGGATLERLSIDVIDSASHEHLWWSGGVTTSGTYSADNLPAGSYLVQAQTHDTGYVYEMWVPGADDPFQDPVFDWNQATPVTVEVATPATGLDFELTEGQQISGRVTSGGLGVANASVQADLIAGGFGSGAGTDVNGDYVITGLVPGSYTVRVESTSVDEPFVAQVWQNRTLYHDGDPVDVTAGDAAGIDFAVAQERVISGQIFLDPNDDQVQQAGEPSFSNVTVRAYDFADGRWLGHAAVAPDGRYAIGVPAGLYRVEAAPHQQNMLWESWQNAYFQEDAQAVDVTAADAVNIDLGLMDGATIGTLRGRVLDAVTLAPIPDLDVQVWRFGNDNHFTSAQTNAAGNFTVINLPVGSYKVRFETGGTDYVASFWSSSGTPGDTNPDNLRIDYPAVAGDGTELGTFALALGGSISGIVRDQANGQPLADVHVSAGEFSGLGYGNGANTDAGGSYVIRGLPEGSYRVQVHAWPQPYVSELFDDTTDWNQATPVAVAAVPPGGPIPITGAIDFDLAQAFSISGQVTEADGTTPVPNLQVTASGLDVSFWEQSWSDSGGTYELGGLPAGSYDVVAETGGTDFARQHQQVDLTSGDVTGVDFALALGATLSGRVFEDVNGNSVYDAGEERADVYVQADDFTTGEYLASGTSGADGRYEIRGLGAGSTRVYVERGEHNFVRVYYDHTFNHGEADPVEVTEVGGVPQDVAGIDFRVLRGYEIHGFVFYDANGDGIQQLPDEGGLQGISINAELQGGVPFDHIWDGTDNAGGYVLHGVYPGHYLVSAHAGGTPYASELYKLIGGLPVGTSRWSEGDQVDATGGDATGIDLSLELGGGITGTVRDALTGAALSTVDLRVDPFDGDGLWWNASTDTQGHYLVNGLPAGDFLLQAGDRQGVYVGEYHQDALFDEDSSPVAVVARGSLSDPLATLVDVDLDEGGAIEGLVYADADANGVRDAGEPGLVGLAIQVEEHAQPHRHLNGSTTDADGTFRVSGLPPGLDLRVRVDTWPTEFIGVYYDGVVTLTAGATTPGIDFGLIAGATISGRVYEDLDASGTYDAGEEIAGAWIQLYDFDTGDWFVNATTDSGGGYELDGLTAGRYEVRLEPDDRNFVRMYWDHRLDGPTPVEIPSVGGVPQDVPGIDFRVVQGFEIRGLVFFDADGDGLWDGGEPGEGGAWVNAWSVDGIHYTWGGTDPDGTYVLHGVYPGRYHVQAGTQDRIAEFWQNVFFQEDAGEVDVTAGSAQNVDFSLIDGSSVGTLRGRVIDTVTLAPIPDLDVQVWRFGNDNHFTGAQTDAAGNFTVIDLPPGSYKVWFNTGGTDYVASFWSVSGTPGDTNPANLRIDYPALAGDGTDLGTFALVLGAKLSGRVFEDVNGNSVYDAGEERADVDVHADDFTTGEYLASGTSGADGRYEIRGLGAGSTRVYVERGEHNFVRVYYDHTFNHGEADPVEVTEVGGVPQDVAGIDFRVLRGYEIHGFVFYDANGDGIQQLPDEGGLQGISINAELQGGVPFDHIWDGTDNAGGYVLHGVYPGHYLVSAHAGGTPYASELYKLIGGLPVGTSRWSEGDQVDATGGDATGIDLSLELGGGITGTVRDALTGAALSTVDLRVDPFDGDGLWWNASTDTQGHYLVNGLPAGDFLLQAGDRQGVYVGEYHQDALFDEDSSPVAVVARGSLSDPLATLVDVDLDEGGAIEGLVYADADANGVRDAGEPGLVGLAIQVEEHAQPHRHLNGSTTDADGTFRVSGLPPGLDLRVRVDTWPTEFIGVYYDGVVTLTAGATTPGIDFGLIAGATISGRVYEDLDASGTYDAGEEIAGAWVNAWSVDDTYSTSVNTEADGTYVLHGLLPDRYLVQAGAQDRIAEYWQDVFFREDASEVDVTAGSAQNVDFSLIDGSSVGTLRGRLLAEGTLAGIPGVDVQVWRVDNEDHITGATTDVDGNFVVTDLAPSPAAGYKVWFETTWSNVDQDTDHVASFWAASGEPGVINPDDLRIVFPTLPDPPSGPGTDLGDFVLTAGGSISGTVYPPGGESLPEGLGVSVQSFESGGPHLPGAQVNTGGGYRIRGLPPATYRVQADTWGTDLAQVYYLSAAESTFDHNTAAAVEVAVAADTAGIDLHLFRGGSISGQVTRALDGTPVAGFPVGAGLVDDPLGRDYWGNADTRADGTYTIRGLPSGSYEVRTDTYSGELANQIYPSLVAVTAPGEISGIDFALDAAGRIRGRVTQVVGGVTEPVVNIRLQADDYDTGEYLSDAHTDAAGDYSLEALPQGRDVRVHVRPWDSPDPQFANFIGEYYNDRLRQDEADPVSIPVDPGGGVSEVTGVDFELALGGAISGFVRDDATPAQPIQNVWVGADDYPGNGLGNGDHTDHNGFYVIRGLPAGSYRVNADPWPQSFVSEYFDDTLDWQQATPVTVQAVVEGEPIPITGNVDFYLATAFAIRGKVTEADGTTPIPGLYVSANGIDLSSWADDTTDSNGEYVLRGLPPGRFNVEVDTTDTDYMRQRQEVEIIDGDLLGVDFALVLGAVLSGRIYEDVDGSGTYDAGEGRAGAYVQADDYNEGWYVASTTSVADGLYEIRGLGAGSYRVRLETDAHNFVRMFYDNVFSHGDSEPMEVTEAGGVPQDVGGIDFRVVRGQEITGFVFYDANRDGFRQVEEPALRDLGIGAENQDGLSVDWAWTGTETDGTYVLHGVYPGRYRVFAEADGTPYAGEIYKLVGGLPMGTWQWSDGDVVDVSGGAAAGIDFSIELGGGITGTVRDAVTGDPVSGIDLWINTFDGDGLWSSGWSDDQGRYLATGLPPGDYQVQAQDGSGFYLGEYYQDAVFHQNATPVHVVARSSLTDPLATLVDFDLAEGGTIAGLVYDDVNGDGVRDAGEAGIGGVSVQVEEHAQPNRGFAGATTAADGTYELGGLPPGLDLRVRVDTWPTDFFGVYYDGGDDRGTTDGDQAAAVTVAAGATTPGINFGLAAGGSISGVVTDGDGVPLPGFGVSAVQLDWRWGGNASTDSDGGYTIHGLEPGTYRLDAGGDPYRYEWYDNQTDWRAATPVDVTARAETAGIDFVLPVMPRIVAGPSPSWGERGLPVSGVTVVAEQLTATPRLEFGAGVTVSSLVFDAASGTFTFDLQVAADAPLGAHSLSLMNDQLVEDGAAILPNAFEVRPAAVGDVPAPYSERLYAVDNGMSQLRVYGATDTKLLGTVDVCATPYAVVMAADGRFAYVNCGDRSLSVVDTRLGPLGLGEEVARLMTVGAFGQQGIDASADYLYAIDRESGLSQIHVIDLGSWLPTAPIEVGMAPWSVRLHPVDQVLWVAHRNNHQLSLIDADPASPTFHQVLGTVPLPAGSWPRGLAFTTDGLRAWVVGNRETFILDTLQARNDPANAVVATLATQNSGRGIIKIAYDTASLKDLVYLQVSDQVWVIDASELRVRRTFTAGLGLNGLAVGADRLFLAHDTSLDFYAVDTAALLDAAALALYRFDVGDAVSGPPVSGPATPSGGLALATATPPAPVSPPVVDAVSGPVENGAAITVTITGSGFGPAPIVSLQGTHVRGTVVSVTAGELQVTLPAETPAGSHTVVVTDPAGGNDSGLSPAPLEVRPAAGFGTTQTVYVSSYGTSRIGVYEPGGVRGEIFTQPYPSGLALTPDGRLGFVAQLYASEWTAWENLPENYLDVSIVDLDPASPTFEQIVATVPWVWSSFSSPAVTPVPENPATDPNRVIRVYAPNYYLSDTVSVIDPLTLAEVDLDDDPTTQSIPPDDPYTWIYGQKLPGMTRIELDDQVTDGDLGPTDTALSWDGLHLYVANQSGSVSIVNTADFTVEPQRLTANGTLGRVRGVVITPGDSPDAVVSVAALDSTGVASLFVFDVGIFNDGAFVDQIVLPTSELPREIAVSSDGMVYLTARLLGELWAVDVRPASRDSTDWGTIERIPLEVGIHEMAEAASDRLFYVSNGFRGEVYVLDLIPGHRHELVTTLHFPGSPGAIAVEPALAGSQVEVTHVSPDRGLPAGGDEVVITGLNFGTDVSVEFGGVAAAGAVVESAFLIRAVTPPGAPATVDVKVANQVPNRRFGILANGFTYAPDTTPPAFTTAPSPTSQVLVGTPGSETVTVEIRWRTNEAADSLVEYRRVGEPAFTPVASAALDVDHLVTLSGLVPAALYEFRATSADASTNSASLPEAPEATAFSTPSAPDVEAPVILGSPLESTTTTTATLQWDTDEEATSIVHYDAVLDNDPTLPAFGADGTTHSVTLTGLEPGTTYEYQVLSVDKSGNGPTASTIDTFTTDSLPDTTPPVFTSGPDVAYLANDLVIVMWVTDEPSTSFVHYGTATVNEASVVDVDLVYQHAVFLTQLEPNTVYGYQAGSSDANGNTTVTADPFAGAPILGPVTLTKSLRFGGVTLPAGTMLLRTKAASGFTTPETPDVTPPVVSEETVTVLSFDRVLVTMTVDEAASLVARYGDGALTATAFVPEYSLTPSLVLTGLEGGSTYELELVLTDPKGNATTPRDLTFTTPAAPDVTPPVISGLAAEAVSPTTTRLSWQTDEPADAAVRFGDRQVGAPGLGTSHALLLSGLEPATPYAYEVTSRDTSGNAATAAGSFTTPTAAPLVTSVTPPRAAQGTTVELTVGGVYLGADAQLALGDGVTVTGLTTHEIGSQLRAAVTVSATAAVGERELLVTTSGGTAVAPFTVVDATVPVVTILEPVAGTELPSRTVFVRGTVSEMADVVVNGVAATVTAGEPLTFEATVTLPEAGRNRIVATAVDASGNRGVAVVVLAVVITDSEPPTLELTAEPSILWPPNHKMVPVVVSVVVTDDQDPAPVVELLSITSNEPDDAVGDGDGHTVNDIQPGADDYEVLLRAERDGGGAGRVYTLTYEAKDQVGNTAVETVEVVVPLNQGAK